MTDTPQTATEQAGDVGAAPEVARYLEAVVALRSAGLADAAEAVLCQAIGWFPHTDALKAEGASLAQARHDGSATVRKWNQPGGADAMLRMLLRGAKALRELRRKAECETLLGLLADEFPDQFAACAEFAECATERRDWPEAMRRWLAVRDRFPDKPQGYVHGARALRELGRHEEAETLLGQAAEQLPAPSGGCRSVGRYCLATE